MTSLGGDNSSSDLHVTSWNSWDNNNNSSDMFCEDKLWNTDLLVQSSWPRLTSCFQYTVLVYAPFGLLWLPLPFHLLSIKVSKDRPLPISCTSATKMVIAFTLAIISAVLIVGDLGSSIKFHEDISLAEYVSYVVRLASYIVMGLLVPYERRCRVTSSGVLFITWFFVVICDVVPFYSKILLKEYEDSLLKFCVFALLYGLEVVMFLLHIKGDNSGIGDLPARTSPEVTTSFIGKYLYTWIARTVFMGWRKDLEERDLFDLNPEYSTGTIMPDFEKKWRHEVSKCKKKRLKQIYRVEKRALASSSHSLQLTEHAEKEKLVDNVSNSNYNTMDLGEGKKQKKVIPSLLKVLIKIGAKDLSIGFMQKCVADLLTMLSPIILSLLISYSSQSTSGDDQWKGYCLAALMFVSQGVKSVVFNGSFWKSQVYGMNLKTILISAIYKKALTMNNEAKKESTIGEIVSLMSVDCQRIQDCMNAFFLGATAPIQVAAIIAVLYMYIGVSVFAGLFVLILTIPLNSYLTTVQQKLQSENLKVKDARLRLTNEALSGMKVLKLYAWEEAFQAKITDLRSQETVVLMKIAYINMITSICFNAVPFFVTLATFAMYVNLSDENVLDANIAFVSLSFFSILRVPLSLLSTVLSMTIQAIVSIGRVNEYLCVGDLNPDNISKNNNSEYAIDIEKGTFTWDRQAPPTLRNVTMKVTPGQLFAVVGQVGSGKSSLMSALLGEMERLSGTASLKGTVAYVPQQAWIQNATVRDNILFGKPYNRKRYTRVIQACALERDLEILSAGDMTEIGEKGINLSGGQKQRVSLARAVYSGADTYVFDDPLSAVDTHVGKHIFNKVISQKGVLKGKTRVLVTHGVHRLPMVDTSLRAGSSLRARMELESRITRVLVTHGVHWLPMVDTILVVEDGTVTENGSYEELMCNDGPFAQFIRTYLLNDDDDDEDGVNQDPEIRAMRAKILSDVETMTSEGLSSDNEALRPSKKPVAGIRRRGMVRQESKTYDSIYPSGAFMQSRMSVYEDENGSDETRGKLVVDEKVEKGKVKRAVFGAFIKAAGVLPFLFSLLLFCGYQVFSAMANYWLAGWTSDPSLLNVTLRGSQEFKDKNDFYLLIFGLFGVAQVAFLIGYNVLYWIRVVIAAKNLHFSMLKSVLRSPMAFFDTTPLGRIMNRFSRDIEVVDNTLPIIIRDGFNTFTVVISTIIIISINTPLFLTLMGPLFVFYVLVQNFYIATSRQLKRLESVTRSPIYSHFSETITGGPVIRAYDVTKRFVGICNARVDRNQALYYASMGSNRWLGANLDVVANIVVFSSALFAVLTPGTNGATIGLSVTYAIQASSSLVWMVRQMSDLETNIVSVERLKEYSEVPSEAEWILPHRRPKSSWPEKGEVEFNSYKTMYRPGLDLVLKGISCTFKPGEKVGIVGRTGAGKSSLALALFRLIEAFEGEIIVDGINLSHIGLHDVRSNLTILPQDPVLFFGTVRMNLDPLDEYSDDQLWESLTSAHLGDFVRSLPGGLEYMVGEEGQSLSVGQRQLVCLARALLKNTKILILDEATAAVDMETDTLIQNTIRSEFEGCTIITIAHRLNTIMDYDRVMVLDAGHIKEFDTPPNLLGDTTTAFFSMAREANLV